MNTHNALFNALAAVSITALAVSCRPDRTMSSIAPEVWEDHIAPDIQRIGFDHGRTFLSFYSEIHVRHQEEVRPLTATASIHNPNVLVPSMWRSPTTSILAVI